MLHSNFLAIFRFLTLMILSINAEYQPNSSRSCHVYGKRGRCIRVNNCPLVATMLQQSLSRTTSYLRENYCGFDGSKPLVCCISEYQLLQAKSTRRPTNNSSGVCQVNGQAGKCLLVKNCELMRILLQRSRKQAIFYLKENQCTFDDSKPLVCCVSVETYLKTLGDTVKNSSTGGSVNSLPQNGIVPTADVSSNPYLPNVCGRDLSMKNLSSGSTVLGEFPWMVLLEYQTHNSTRTGCSGSLINRRYVLTAAHCVIDNDILTIWELTSVRLGEHNTDTEIDCVKDDQGNVQCADRPISVGIEEQIVYKDYGPSTYGSLPDDIALLRLNHDVPFTKFIRPICLPKTSSAGDKLYVAGWHKQFERSNLKFKLSLSLVDKVECRNLYDGGISCLGKDQICARGEDGYDACRGDSGSPMMSFEGVRGKTDRWTVVGILSTGPIPCGVRHIPDVYTKISPYVPWILSKIRA